MEKNGLQPIEGLLKVDHITSPSTKDEVQTIDKRQTWGGRLDFFMTILGFAIGIGNVWRFPYICYRDGGGAFLIPYVIMLIVVGIPTMLLLLACGQFCSSGPITCRKYSPIFKGIGINQVLSSFIGQSLYSVVVSWSWFYLFASFAKTLPWDTCWASWNSAACYDRLPDVACNETGNVMYGNGTCYNGTALIGVWDYSSFVNQTGIERKLAGEEYFSNRVLSMTTGVHDIGTIRWELSLCHMFGWVVIFCCLIKGVKSIGKVAYVTTLTPYILLFILLVKAATLPNSLMGMKYLMVPKWHHLKDPRVWYDAASQIFFSIGLGGGILITCGSYNTFHHNIIRDVMIVPILNALCSLFAALSVFGFLGFMAFKMNTSVDSIVAAGPGLAFIAFPELVNDMSVSPMWSIFFFLTLIMLSVGCQMVTAESIRTAIVDEFKILGQHRNKVAAVMCSLSFLLGLPLVTQGGVYLLTLLDHYIAGWLLVGTSLIETISIAWVYGIKRFMKDISVMVGYQPSYWWQLSLAVLSPLIMTFIMLMQFVTYQPVRYGRDYYFPAWADGIGWIMTVFVMIWIPIVAIYQVATIGKGSIWEKIKMASRPTRDWGPKRVQDRRLVDYVDNFVLQPAVIQEEMELFK